LIKAAGDILFNTPLPTEIPTDSFEADYEPDYIRGVENDLNLDTIDQINGSKNKTLSASSDGHKRSKGSKHSKKRRPTKGK